MKANGQLNRKIKVIREPKSYMDMVIPCLGKLRKGATIENTIKVNGEIAYQLKMNENYYITKTGILYSIYIKGAHGKTDVNKPHKVIYGQDRDGYYRVVLSNNKTRKYVKIHRLVVEQFLGEIPEGMVINHIDGNKQNNNVNNLEIITSGENTRHAWRTGLASKDKIPHSVKVDVYDHVEDKLHHLESIADVKRLTSLKWSYINKIRLNEEPCFHECKFVKIIDGHGVKNYHIECYYNGILFKTFRDVTEAGTYFGRPYNSVSGAFKSKYSEKTNRFTLTFPNVSTIESIAS